MYCISYMDISAYLIHPRCPRFTLFPPPRHPTFAPLA